ncbi:TetR/AcrR family transcriptional regulator [Nocardia sp. CDC159]|uniref:TetR/AcrR family transcriptional regulator n=1 Tax=Nocardia pulmonis TaxID=2951408 RepID=A0A9X2E343_9NOCA|nr:MULTISPECIES: TetR/AcrR family transcriptional regulator [Nocardia]MCM6772218.1 TetR/AcrR family transcriptional regulator [Nocardia pulmonis]MCM6785124.1 TetR/AcrR family transcriptional regulator [Nocardia sp. CDC159]
MTTAPARRRGRPPAATAEQTRWRITRVAVELFAAKGFHGTGVAEIGDRADVQRGALYYHIGSKEELLFQILRDYTAVMDAEASEIESSDDDPVTKLRRLIHSHIRLIIEHRLEVAIQLRDVSALTGERAADLQELRDQVQQRWQRVIDAGHAEGLLRTSDHVITNGILGMLNSVTLWYRPRGGHGPDAIADLLASTVLDGLVHSTDTKG